MKKTKYYLNTENLRYEQIQSTWKSLIINALGFICAAAVFATIILFFAFRFFDSPKEKQLRRELSQTMLKFEQLNKKIDYLDKVSTSLQKRDDEIYRVIFEAAPIPTTIREAGFGGGEQFKYLENFSNSDLLISTAKRLEKMSTSLYIQSKSYDEITDLLKNKEEMLASIPAIQPISNKSLQMIASGFGLRVHPIYKTRKMHTGIDFAAPTGTKIFATGKGTIQSINDAGRGYGNSIVINHGYNYQTLYGHLSKILVKPGQKIKRGDVIGLVGSTGTSTAPHLHYEVIKNNDKINPINFFYNDLSPTEYNQVVTIASQSNQSFD